MLIRKWHTLALVVVLSALVGGACAARGPRNQTRVAALTVGETALAIDKAERDVFAANLPGYDTAVHTKVGAEVLKVLYASRAFERAAAAWPEGVTTMPAAVEAARAGLLVAMADLEHVLPQVAAARDPIIRALAALRAALATNSATRALPTVTVAQLPSGGILGFMALVNLLATLVASGRTTYAKLRGLAQQAGATAEELAALDANLTDAIVRRESEQPGS